jgi:hypothetical protein
MMDTEQKTNMHYTISKAQIEQLLKTDRLFKAETDMLQGLLDQPEGEPVATPPFGTKRKAAIALYKPPFKFEHGYIFDAEHHMVADDDNVKNHVVARVRGWGRIGYMPDAAQLQDEVGRVIADALNAYWGNSKPAPFTPITADDVTDEICAEVPINLDTTKQDIADIYNMVSKHMRAKK